MNRQLRARTQLAGLLALLFTATACGLFSTPDAVPLDEALGPLPTATAIPSIPEPTVAPEAAATPEPTPGPTATPTTAPTATPTPTPAWQPVAAADGLQFEVPSSWMVTDAQEDVDAIMGNEATTAALDDLGVAPLLDLFEVNVRGLIDAPDESKVIYVTIDRSPVPSLGALDTLGDLIASQAGVTLVDRAVIETPIGPGLRAQTELEDTGYNAWFWIDDGAARLLIFRGDIAAERHAIETLSD